MRFVHKNSLSSSFFEEYYQISILCKPNFPIPDTTRFEFFIKKTLLFRSVFYKNSDTYNYIYILSLNGSMEVTAGDIGPTVPFAFILSPTTIHCPFLTFGFREVNYYRQLHLFVLNIGTVYRYNIVTLLNIYVMVHGSYTSYLSLKEKNISRLYKISAILATISS